MINRALLRSVRRFYLEEFKKDNKRIVKKRFKQVKVIDIFKGFKKTRNRLFGDNFQNDDTITQFVMIISSVKCKGKYSYDEEIKAKGELVARQMQDYSYGTFQKIFEIKEFEFIVKYLLENHYDRIFKFTSHMRKIDRQGYLEEFQKWMSNFSECKNGI